MIFKPTLYYRLKFAKKLCTLILSVRFVLHITTRIETTVDSGYTPGAYFAKISGGQELIRRGLVRRWGVISSNIQNYY